MSDALKRMDDFYKHNASALDLIDSLSEMRGIMNDMEFEIIELREYKKKYEDLVNEALPELGGS